MQFLEERIGELLGQIGKLRYENEINISDWKYCSSQEKKPYEEWQKMDFVHTLGEDTRWEGKDKYYAFHTNFQIPAQFSGKNLEFYLITGKEGEWDATNPQCLLFINGKIVQGMDVNHQEAYLGGTYQEGDMLSIFVMAYTGEHTEDLHFKASLRDVNLEIEKYYYDLLIPYQAACLQEKNDKTYCNMIQAVNEALNLLDLRRPYSTIFWDSLHESAEYFKTAFYEKQCGSFDAEVYCVGHTHIDVAWLWTLSVTQDKAVRSFATVVNLMKQYPNYIFMSSQPQLYQYVKDAAPELYEEIKKLVAEGRWEVEGGTWLEPDCNIPSGESFVRQFLYGKRFFREEFGKDNQILWLPDVFGYSAALPQIMEKSGVHYFMTTKISWNESNQMPYDTFYWEGLDGTKVLSHFIATRDYESTTRHPITTAEHKTEFTTNYNGYTHPSQVKGGWQRYQQKELNGEILLSYGHGDGGGGTTKWMIESVERMNHALPGMPKTRHSRALDYFKTLESHVKDQKKTPIWSGELYLEYHRATYTSMGRNKNYNRKIEFMLNNTEYLSALTGIYDKEKLDQVWIVLLRNQFHDILPGSSIPEVYEDSKVEYETIQKTLREMLDNLYQEALKKVQGKSGDAVVYNYNGLPLSGLVTVEKCETETSNTMAHTGNTSGEAQSIEGLDSLQGITQISHTGDIMMQVSSIPGKGYVNLSAHPECVITEVPGMEHFDLTHIENQYYSIQLNEKGQMISFYDKEAEREILQTGEKGNVFMTYEDKPHYCDNWNLYEYYTEKSWEVDQLLSSKIIEEGPLRYGLEFTYQYLDSTICEKLYFYPDQRNVDMEMDIDWKEDQIFLKLLYPVELYTKEATFEIQYGNVKRNMIKNTSWDLAKFEVCMHKWMDISEDDSYGISFINDCKFGVSVENNVVGLSLIKSGMYPNPHADREQHHVVYSIYPHTRGWRNADTVEKAYLMNNPMQIMMKNEDTAEGNTVCAGLNTGLKNVITEVIKPAESGEGMVARFYECHGSRSKVVLPVPEGVSSVWLSNMIETEEEKMEAEAGKVTFWMKPYEIVTLHLV